jgi:tRNA U34 5-carboxymethylaminomethyl modifying enzyme MnmG/GidA
VHVDGGWFDVVAVGVGHAGGEAAACFEARTAMITQKKDTIGKLF